MVLKPLGERVLVRVDKAEEKTSSGIYIPQAAQEKTQTAVIEAVGGASKLEGLSKGVRVLFDKYTGASFKGENGDEYLFLKEEDILAIIES